MERDCASVRGQYSCLDACLSSSWHVGNGPRRGGNDERSDSPNLLEFKQRTF